MTLSRNAPLTRKPGSYLQRTPFPRGSAELARTPWARGVPGIATSPGPAKKAATRNSGPTPKLRKLVLERDGFTCVCCGISIIGRHYSLGHRLRAGQGGQAVPSNLLTFLGLGGELHHGRIDSRRDPADEAKGYTVRSWQDPAQIPVMVFSEGGSGVMAWVWDDGKYHFDGPQEAAS